MQSEEEDRLEKIKAAKAQALKVKLPKHRQVADRLRLRHWADRHESKIDALSGGSLRAAVNLMCIDCCCGETTEIRDCTAVGCPLYSLRPYQPRSIGG